MAIPRPSCHSCGREIPTASELARKGLRTGKMEIWLLCSDCVEKALRLQVEFETRWLEYKLYGKPKPDIDAFLTEKSADIDALKIPSWYWKWYLLHRIQHAYERVTA